MIAGPWILRFKNASFYTLYFITNEIKVGGPFECLKKSKIIDR